MRSWLFSAVLLEMLISSLTVSFASESTVIRILFTNNSNGKLVGCPTCREDPYGGLAERVDLVRSYRETYPEVLLLDSGGYFNLMKVEKTAEKIFRLMEIMGYEVWGIGDQELYHGLGKFLELAGQYEQKIVNTSIVADTGDKVFTPYRIVEVHGVRIGITGILSNEAVRFLPPDTRDYKIEEPDSTLGELLPVLKESSDYIIVLSQLGINADRKLAARWHDIDLIIGGHSQTLLEEPEMVDGSGCRIVQAGKNAGRVGEVVLAFDGGELENFSYRLVPVTKKYTVLPDIKELINAPSYNTEQ